MSRRVKRTIHLLATAMATPAALIGTTAAYAQSTNAPASTPTPVPASIPTAATLGLDLDKSRGDRVQAFSDTLSPYYGNIRTFWGNIRTFWGDATPYWGNIRTFWGDVSPYDGDLSAFWGNIRTFNDTTDDTALLPAWGNIRTFAGELGAEWGNIRTFWGNIRTFDQAPTDYDQLAQLLNQMVASSETTFGTAVQGQTGQSFMDGFANPLLARYGIDLSVPGTLEHLDANEREHFIMDWWDGLMNFSGADHVDHWMKEVNWTPALTQTLGQGKRTTIGVLDFTIGGAAAGNVIKYGGVSSITSPHGTAVASLMVDPIDGKGVMGIAPKASVVEYNPFDANMTAGWVDIKDGVEMLAQNGASVVNMSLGVQGWTLHPGWNDVFSDKAIQKIADNTVFVIAAGNDGIAQTQNVPWDNHNPAIIVVGSVDPLSRISSFSNQPGTACLLESNGKCKGDYLMNHFVVAPGELMLVSDGQGGVTRMSGTSFAAPLVSGTIALIHDRWPWLQNQPNDTASIIFKSARDLGAPGVDSVYGWGELDVQAALSPLDWNKLVFFQTTNGFTTGSSAQQLRATSAATRATWEARNVYFTLYENTGHSFRDFEIPMSTKLANKTVSVWGGQEQFMSYLQSRFTGWLGAPTRFTNALAAAPQFTDLTGATQQLAAGNAVASLTVKPRTTQLGFRASQVPLESTMRIASDDGHFALAFGNGGSAGLIGGQSGFAMASDYDVENGGANPFLGFASGGSFANIALRIAPGLVASSGFTQRTLRVDGANMPVALRGVFDASRPYAAVAGNVTLTYAGTARFNASLGYTLLHEDSAVLGMASADAGDLPHGSSTDAATLGADYSIAGFRLAASATLGRTRASEAAVNRLAVGRSGLLSTAFQIAASKNRLFDAHDRLRVTLAQPMHVERGSLDIAMIKVVDRATGELGEVTERAPVIGAPRRLVGEMMYGRTLPGGAGELSLFARAQLKGNRDGQWPSAMGGFTFRLGF